MRCVCGGQGYRNDRRYFGLVGRRRLSHGRVEYSKAAMSCGIEGDRGRNRTRIDGALHRRANPQHLPILGGPSSSSSPSFVTNLPSRWIVPLALTRRISSLSIDKERKFFYPSQGRNSRQPTAMETRPLQAAAMHSFECDAGSRLLTEYPRPPTLLLEACSCSAERTGLI